MSKSNPKPRGKSKSRSSKGKAQRPLPSLGVNLTLDQKLDIAGIVLVALGGITLLSLLSSSQGAITGWWLGLLRETFGWGVFVAPLVLAAAGLWLLLRSFEQLPRLSGEQVIGFVLVLMVGLLTMQIVATVVPGGGETALVAVGAGGGRVGEWLRVTLVTAIGSVGIAVLMAAWWLVALVMCLGLRPSQLLGPLAALLGGLRRRPAAGGTTSLVINNGSPAHHKSQPADAPVEAQRRAPPRATPPAAGPSPRILGEPVAPSTAAAPTGPLYRAAPVPQVAWELPKIEDVFEPGGEATLSEEDLRTKAKIIEETLHHLGVEGKVVEVNRGPAITQFGVEPGFVTSRDGRQTKVKVSRITALADDLALALAARTIRIEAPVPGRNIVGIEVPNAETALVSLRDVMESESFAKIKSRLAIALGQDVSGQPVATDLAAMPHLLIAGTTGSGKSVCINAVISCLLARNTPDDLRLLMVDPKRVELTTYNGIPHLMAPVVVDLERVVGTLQWVTREMDGRYRKFAKAGARNVDDYNARAAAHKDVPGQEKMDKLPYIVVVIDELADLMMLAPDETERTICRLAQMARATGIHLVIATQRPSVDVVTGLIKANFPARISFAVASSVDSRVILDGPGAEQLLGRGDMLFVSPESGQPVRLQGCFVADKEILKLVRYWKGMRGATDTASPEAALAEAKAPVQQPLWEDMRADLEKAQGEQEDDLLERAIQVVRLQRRASISLLQRKLQIGYTRAARLIDRMEQKGIVGPPEEGNRWREVLISAPTGRSAVEDEFGDQ